MNGWKEYKHEPCPICGHKGWCGHSDDGVVVHCMRVQSANACPSGGWFHFLVERPVRRQFAAPKAPRRTPRLLDAEKTMSGFRDEFAYPDIFDALLEIGKDIQLVPSHIDRLIVGRSAFHRAWAFPMRDADGKTIGIRLREYGSSKKWSVAGSADGLFYDPELTPAETMANGLKGREIVIVEGATDTIAGYQIGLPCVGRSSCSTGADLIRSLCGRLRVTRITIVADNDTYKRTADGRVWRPGINGAEKLANSLGRIYRIVTPPKKDLREWMYAGCDAKTFWKVASLQPWKISKGIS